MRSSARSGAHRIGPAFRGRPFCRRGVRHSARRARAGRLRARGWRPDAGSAWSPTSAAAPSSPGGGSADLDLPAARDQPRPRDAAQRPLPVDAQAARRRRATATCRTARPPTGCPSCSRDRLRWRRALPPLAHQQSARRSPRRRSARRSRARARRPRSVDREPSQFEPTPWLEVQRAVRAQGDRLSAARDPRSAGQGDPQRARARSASPRCEEVRAGKSFEIDLGRSTTRRRRPTASPRCASSCSPTPSSRSTRSRVAARAERPAVKCGVVVFPGIELRPRRLPRAEARARAGGHLPLARGDDRSRACELVVLPGGWSYGDYLRGGAMAALSPVMQAVREHAAHGRPGARHLQRLPGAHRGAAPARRAAAQRGLALRVPRRLSAGRAQRPRLHQPLPPGPGPAPADRPWRGQLRALPRRARPARGRTGRSSSATSRPAGELDDGAGTSTARRGRSPASATRRATSSA